MTVLAMDSLMAVEKEFNLTPAETVGLLVRGELPEKLQNTPKKVINERMARAIAAATPNAHEFHHTEDKLVGGEKPAPVARPDAINPWLSPLKFLGARKEHNARVDPDEQLSFKEFKKYCNSGVLPVRVKPARILNVKFERTKDTLAELDENANATRFMSWGLFGAVTQFQHVFRDINNLKAAIDDVAAYAHTHDLPAPDTRYMADAAVRETEWHVNKEFRIRGFLVDDFASTYHQACDNYLELKRLAA